MLIKIQTHTYIYIYIKRERERKKKYLGIIVVECWARRNRRRCLMMLASASERIIAGRSDVLCFLRRHCLVSLVPFFLVVVCWRVSVVGERMRNESKKKIDFVCVCLFVVSLVDFVGGRSLRWPSAIGVGVVGVVSIGHGLRGFAPKKKRRLATVSKNE